MSERWAPITPDELVARLADGLARGDGLVRVAIDGAPAARPESLADELVAPLRALGRPVAHVRAETFWRDASLRFEHGREDVESFLGWLDADALRREVLVPAARDGRYLPSLRDPATNRSTRAAPVPVEPGTVLIVSGALLVGLGLPFELTVHLTLSPSALARRTPEPDAWTLPAFAEYDASAQPARYADVVVKLDDPRHPAVRGLTAAG